MKRGVSLQLFRKSDLLKRGRKKAQPLWEYYKKRRKKSSKVKDNSKASISVNYLTKLVAELADVHGIWASDLASHPEILEEAGIDAEDITTKVAEEADWYNDKQLALLMTQHAVGGVNIDNFPSSQSNHRKLFGLRLSLIIRWMGSDDWNLAEAEEALQSLGFHIRRSEVQWNLWAGRKKKREVPRLKEEQRRFLRLAAE